jgi:hypothetical protein
MNPFDLAWLLLKAPVLDTPLDNLQMVYNENPNDFPNIIGSGRNHVMHRPWGGSQAKIEHMTPNEYFDAMKNTPEGSRVPKPLNHDWNAERRWGKHEGSEDYINQVADRLRNGEEQHMEIPELEYDAEEKTSYQEGGHRMEALRQLGHGNQQFPVMVRRNQQ